MANNERRPSRFILNPDSMLRSPWAGVTLVELVVSLVLLAVVAASVHQLLISSHRSARYHAERAQLTANLRVAAAILPAELGGLDATGSAGSDIVAMSDSTITYRSMRGLHMLCRNPTLTGPASGTLVLAAARPSGVRRPDPARHWLLIFAEADPMTETDNHWVRADLADAARGSACPGQAPSITVSVVNVVPPGSLKDVQRGAPVGSYELVELRGYRDGRGDWWLGVRRRAKGRRWSATQPVLGPLAPGGLRLSYWHSTGARASSATDVARIGITLIGRSNEPVRAPTGAQRHLLDTLSIQIVLKNNQRSRWIRS